MVAMGNKVSAVDRKANTFPGNINCYDKFEEI